MNQQCLKWFQTVLETQEKKNYKKEEFKKEWKKFYKFQKNIMNYGKISLIYNDSFVAKREHKKLHFIKIQMIFKEYNQKTSRVYEVDNDLIMLS